MILFQKLLKLTLVYTFLVIPYSNRARPQIYTFNVLYELHDKIISLKCMKLKGMQLRGCTSATRKLQVRVWNTCKLHEISQLQLIKYVYWDYWIYIYS